MSLSNVGIFRSALIVESVANIGSMFPLILSPGAFLHYLLIPGSEATPAAKTLTQIFGAIVALPTAMLLLAFPDPTPKDPPNVVTARRRLTYFTMGVSELALGLVTAAQYLQGGSGFADDALLAMSGCFTSLVAFRAFFLYVRPDLIEAKATSIKAS